MARKTGEELEVIKKKYNVCELYSWSKYNTAKSDFYEFYLKYIAKIPEDRSDGIYGVSGNECHDILEQFYNKQINFEDMLPLYEDKLENFNIIELKYDRTNDENNKKIAKKYEECIKHFFQYHQPIHKKVALEKFILIKVGKFLFQGYIDFTHKEGIYFIITDWKTSTIYTGKKIDKEKGQLLLYAEGLRQLGVPLENIKIRWGFLKYVTVEIQQANGKTTQRNIVRNEIGKSLSSNVKMWLNKSKCYSEEQIEAYIDMISLTNSLDCLPEDIKSKYKVDDCYVYIPFTEEEIEKLKEDIINTIVSISKKEAEYMRTKDENIWWEDITDEKSYYFANLSGYSAKLHKPYAAYLEKFKSSDNKEDEDDMSWLEEI